MPVKINLDTITRSTTLWKDTRGRFCKNRLALISACIFLGIFFICVAGPLFSPYTYQQQDLTRTKEPPSHDHWLGTDLLGRDLATRILYGGRVSLGVGVAATMVSLIIGLSYGMLAGYAGGVTDTILMRIVDILYAIPFTIFVIILMVIFGRSIVLLFAAIGAVEWLTMARIVRAQVRDLKKQEFIQAALLLGIPKIRIFIKHLLPNLLGPITVYTTLTVPAVMLLEATLSFLGLGVQPPMSSWGSLIRDGAEAMEVFPWLLIFPATIFSLSLFTLNFIGDGLRDAMDPRSAID